MFEVSIPTRLRRSVLSLSVFTTALLSFAHADEPTLSTAIDQHIQAELDRLGISPASPASDYQLIRRTTLDLAGRLPLASETRAFVADESDNKRTALVDRLLASPDFAFHQRNELDRLLQANLETNNEWRDWLLAAVKANTTWDELFRSIIIADESDPKQKGASAFLKKRFNDLDSLTNDTSKLFFGVSINCAQCHDHPLVEDWLQDHYFGFKSFFSRTYKTKTNVLAEKFGGEIKFKTTEGEEKVARLMFLTGDVLEDPTASRSDEQKKKDNERIQKFVKDAKAGTPPVPEFSPRRKLVELALNDAKNQFFAKSIANRIWLRFFGTGLVDPPDQMHSENPASHPELLAALATELVAQKYDLKHLIRGIVLSQAYARTSQFEDGKPEDAESKINSYAVLNARILSPRQYAAALEVASANPVKLDEKAKDRTKWREKFEKNIDGFSREFELPGENFQVSVEEALLLTNGSKMAGNLLSAGGDRLLGHLKTLPDNSAKVDAAFLTILSRPPTDGERKHILQYLNDRPDDAVSHIVWALLTSPEMRFNH